MSFGIFIRREKTQDVLHDLGSARARACEKGSPHSSAIFSVWKKRREKGQKIHPSVLHWPVLSQKINPGDVFSASLQTSPLFPPCIVVVYEEAFGIYSIQRGSRKLGFWLMMAIWFDLPLYYAIENHFAQCFCPIFFGWGPFLSPFLPILLYPLQQKYFLRVQQSHFYT